MVAGSSEAKARNPDSMIGKVLKLPFLPLIAYIGTIRVGIDQYTRPNAANQAGSNGNHLTSPRRRGGGGVRSVHYLMKLGSG